MVDIKLGGKTHFQNMLIYIATVKVVNEKEVRGVLRWFVSLRTAETVVQLPAAHAVLDWLARLLQSLRLCS